MNSEIIMFETYAYKVEPNDLLKFNYTKNRNITSSNHDMTHTILNVGPYKFTAN